MQHENCDSRMHGVALVKLQQKITRLNSIVIELQDADEIEAFYLETTGMKPGYVPLSSGASGLKTRITDLQGVSLIWTQGENHIRWVDQMVGDGLHLAFALDCEGEITNRGRAIDADEGQVWMPGREMDLIINGPYLSLGVPGQFRMENCDGSRSRPGKPGTGYFPMASFTPEQEP